MRKWLKEIARDLLALGSIPFYFLAIIRSIIGQYDIFVYNLLIAAAIIFALHFIIKDSDLHIARSFVIVVFTSLFYKEMFFTFFVALVWILMLFSAYYIRRSLGSILRGIIIGVLGSAAGYYVAFYFK